MSTKKKDWWKATAEQHERDWQQIKLLGGPEEAHAAGLMVDEKYDPSLITGKCRCEACKAARETKEINRD